MKKDLKIFIKLELSPSFKVAFKLLRKKGRINPGYVRNLVEGFYGSIFKISLTKINKNRFVYLIEPSDVLRKYISR